MNANNPAAARFQLLDRPMVLPAKCCVCGAVDRPVIDFGLSIDYYGAVYFCDECMASGARAIDYVPVAEVDKAYEHAELIVERQEEVENILLQKASEINDLVNGIAGDISAIFGREFVATKQEPSAESGNGEIDSPTAESKPKFSLAALE